MKPLLCIALLSLMANAALGEVRYFKADVVKTMIHEQEFGQCMAMIKPSPEQNGLDCKKGWVTFSCSGDFNLAETGFQKLAAAQLALLSGDPVFVQVDDYRKHNGYCYAQRIDNTRQ